MKTLLEPHRLGIFFDAFTQTTPTRTTEAHIARHKRAAIRAGINVLCARTILSLVIRVNFRLHGYILSSGRESDEA
jgi:hypothetical protein